MSDTHKVPVVRIQEVRKHPNADSLGLVDIGGYQVVVKLDDFKPGDLGVYIQPDSIVPEIPPFSFLWADTEERPVPVRKRRITVRKFRKEWSEGLLLPCTDFLSYVIYESRLELENETIQEGDDVAELLGITHYDPDAGKELAGDNEHAPGTRQNRRWPRSFKGWLFWFWNIITRNPVGSQGNEKAPQVFRPVYDVDALKNHKDAFQEGELVVVTEKIHGSNARYTYDEGLLGGHLYAGSRNFWKKPGSKNIWRKALEANPWIEEWCKAHPGYTLYGEVVPTQKGFDYGATPEQPKFFVFDILNPDGKWEQIPVPEIVANDLWIIPGQVPTLFYGPYNSPSPGNPAALDLSHILVDGPSIVPGTKHIREGIVIRAVPDREVRHLGRLQLKIISNEFLLKDNK